MSDRRSQASSPASRRSVSEDVKALAWRYQTDTLATVLEPELCLCDAVHIGAVRALAVVAGGGGNRTLPTANDATDGVYERPHDTGQSSDRVAEIAGRREGADPAKPQIRREIEQ